jgi:O-antigen/teichoic acid export membrane protein
MRIDQVMVEYFTSKIELGVYSAGVKIIEVIKFIPIIFLTAILPEIVNSFDKGTEETEAKTAYLHGIQFLFCISVLFFVLLFGDYMINLLYGETFAESALVVKLYSFLMIISIFSSTRNKLLIVKNSSKVVLWFSLLVLSMNIVFNIVFIQRYGTVGAIWGSILSYILATFIFLFSKSYRRESLLPFSYLLKKMRNN